MSPVSIAVLVLALLATGIMGYLVYTHVTASSRRSVASFATLEQLAHAIESGGVTLPRKASLEKMDSWIQLGPRRYDIELARIAFSGCHLYAEPRGREALEVWGNWTSCGIMSTPVLKGRVLEFYTVNNTGEVNSITVTGNKTLLVVWVDRVETPWWTVSLDRPTRIVVLEKVLSGN